MHPLFWDPELSRMHLHPQIQIPNTFPAIIFTGYWESEWYQHEFLIIQVFPRTTSRVMQGPIVGQCTWTLKKPKWDTGCNCNCCGDNICSAVLATQWPVPNSVQKCNFIINAKICICLTATSSSLLHSWPWNCPFLPKLVLQTTRRHHVTAQWSKGVK